MYINSEYTYIHPSRSATSDLGLHSLSMFHKKDARLACIWANNDYIGDNTCNGI